MSRPLVGSFAEQAYEAVAPLSYADESYGWPLLCLLGAIGSMFQLVEDLSRDTDDGPGWSAALDVDRAPEAALPWLAQFVGVRIPLGLDEAQQRARIRSTDGFRRGTPAALVGAAQQYLTGSKTVIFRERDGGAYKLKVWTRTSETPDSAKVLAALLEQKPAGITLTYAAIADWIYDDISSSFGSYSAIYTTYVTYQGVLTNSPGT